MTRHSCGSRANANRAPRAPLLTQGAADEGDGGADRGVLPAGEIDLRRALLGLGEVDALAGGVAVLLAQRLRRSDAIRRAVRRRCASLAAADDAGGQRL